MRVVFLDRDGVINDNSQIQYVSEWEEFKFLPDTAKAIKCLNDNKIKVILITNQSGINRGLLTHEKLDDIHEKMVSELSRAGARIDDIFYCPHRPDENCSCRKPRTGLLEKAREKYGMDFNHSWFIGDTESDVLAGEKAGCRTYLLKRGESLFSAVKKVLGE
jgi:D-glycero-D-manno-heptose 1,7-bisphosphate phosphatase